METEVSQTQERFKQEFHRKLECALCHAYTQVCNDVGDHDEQAWASVAELAKAHDRRAHPEYIRAARAAAIERIRADQTSL